MTQKELIVAISRKTGYKAEMVENIMAAYIDIAIKEFMKKGRYGSANSGHCVMYRQLCIMGTIPSKGDTKFSKAGTR
ncbi:hypothetical protein SFC43_13665 [Bacteroides sp. CR5/BHMF/2]|nr:hypothetical protein [Bacteroides sp. CR5/BHMF/2]